MVRNLDGEMREFLGPNDEDEEEEKHWSDFDF